MSPQQAGFLKERADGDVTGVCARQQVLLDFAHRHAFIADDTEAATRAELVRLHGVLASR